MQELLAISDSFLQNVLHFYEDVFKKAETNSEQRKNKAAFSTDEHRKLFCDLKILPRCHNQPAINHLGRIIIVEACYLKPIILLRS